MGSTPRKYLPDFIVQIDDGHILSPSPPRSGGEGRGEMALGTPGATPDFLNLIVEIKGFRGEDAKYKANTMRNYWVPGVNNVGKFGRWAFAEFTSVFEIERDFDKVVKAAIAAGKKSAA